jgi:serine/threonine-protein kinase RsbW
VGVSDDSRTVRLTIPAKPEYITLSRLALSGLARVRPLAEETLADLKLALTEACSNSVRHAYDDDEGHVDISFELRDDRLIVEVADDGSGFEPDETAKNGDEALTEGGLGISIIRSIADEVEIGSGAEGKGSRLRFVKLL